MEPETKRLEEEIKRLKKVREQIEVVESMKQEIKRLRTEIEDIIKPKKPKGILSRFFVIEDKKNSWEREYL